MKTIIQRIKLLSWTEVVVAVCIVNFLLIHTIPFLITGVDQISAAIFVGAYYKAFISGGYEFFRFLTVGFVHINLLHLAVNCIALLRLGKACENIYSPKKALIIFLCSIVGGSLLTYGIEGNIVAVGLSGGAYGLMAAFIVYFFETGLIKNPIYKQYVFQIILINLFINFLPNVSITGHLGGFITGLLMGFLFSRNEDWEEARKSTKISMAILILFIPFLIYRSYKIPSNQIFRGTDQQVFSIMDSVGLSFYSHWLNNRTLEYYRGLEE